MVPVVAAQAAQKTAEGVKKLFSNKKFLFWFITIVLLFIIWRRYGYLVKNVFKRKDIDLEEGESVTLDPFREAIIESTAREIYDDIEDTGWFGHDYSAYYIAYDFTDNELRYLYQYYQSQFGQSLISAIDSQWYITDDIPKKLRTKLQAIGFN